ncbi:MAG TPA: PP2C family protein-serine/threonine phosphatase [Acidimicrobiales bacterium]|nr:PP2C family protein-serine/threonine phosphatase [Acidimicrobiales bacterium]
MNSVLKLDESAAPVLVRTAMFDATERRAYETELLAARRRAEESEARATALARTLQATFLPPAIGPIPGLDVAGAYRPAGDGTEVGGDFYDLFETERGSWSVVLGDVCGKGAGAAVVTALVRYTVRAEALHAPCPSAVLRTLHHALVRDQPENCCTAVFVRLEQGDGGVRAGVSSGGHPLPLCHRADGTVEAVGRNGTMLGILDEPALHDDTTVLRAGDLLVLYTDGVTEARRDGEFFGTGRLRATLGSVAGSEAQAVADGIVAAAVEFQGGDARDDIAVVAVRVPPNGPSRG